MALSPRAAAVVACLVTGGLMVTGCTATEPDGTKSKKEHRQTQAPVDDGLGDDEGAAPTAWSSPRTRTPPGRPPNI